MDINELDKKLEKAYNSMLKWTKEMLEDVEEHTIPAIQEALKKAKEKTLALEEITEEEAEKLAEYLKRDLHGAAEELKTSGKELETVVKYDLLMLGQKFWELLARHADQSKIELLKFEQQFCHPVEYKTGEVTSAGTLICNDCGHHLEIKKSKRIPKCPKCKASSFTKLHQ